MKKINLELWLCRCLSISFLTLTFLSHAQEVPPEPANVISNNYTANFPAPAAILFQTTNVSVQVSNAVGKVWDVNLRTEITHQFPVDIDMHLTSPQGTRVYLLSSSAGNGYGGANQGVFNGTWWDDQAPTNAADAVYTPMILQPSLQPVGAMSAFDGENPNGTWTLTITDTFAPDNGSLNSAQLNIATYVGHPTYVTKSYTNSVSTPIPDNASINPTVSVTGLPYRISEVKVFTKTPHTASTDLDIFLTSPAGTQIALVTDRAGINDNVFNGTLWYDNATKQVASVTNVYADNVVETELIPEGCLGAFKGENPNGTWTLNVADDNANGELGNLDNWWIEITTCSAGVNDVNGDGYTDIVGVRKKEVRVLSQAAGTATNATSYGKLPKGYKVVGGFDVNTNGTSDLIVQRKDQISYLDITNGSVPATPVAITTAPKRYKVVASGDINSDDYTDIIVARGKKVSVLMGPNYTAQEIIEKNKNGKVVGAVQANIVTQKGKKVYRMPVNSSGTNTVTVGEPVTLTEDAAGKVVGVTEINTNDGYEIVAQKKKDITYGAWDSGNYTTDLWTDKGKEKDSRVGKVVAPQ
jgi:subtilisin-like proprotein convertase family protein